MPPRRSRSRERGPQSGPSRQGSPSNKPCPRLLNKDASESYPPRTSGVSIPPLKLVDLDSNMNASSGARTTTMPGSPSRSANMPKTQSGLRAAPASREVTSPASTPNSPGYFDPSQETADPPSFPRSTQGQEQALPPNLPSPPLPRSAPGGPAVLGVGAELRQKNRHLGMGGAPPTTSIQPQKLKTLKEKGFKKTPQSVPDHPPQVQQTAMKKNQRQTQ